MSTARHRYLPALDGLRACAVGGVLLYHGGVSWAKGGFLGVDLFFVLSGFLITSLLLAERVSTGRIALGAFWARRARRLLPALFLVLGAVILYAGFLAAPAELRNIRGDVLASLGYVANWHFIDSGQSYFGQFLAPSPLRHMWSLAIEEQFYLFWPLLVFGVLRWRRANIRALATVTTIVATSSVALMVLLYNSDDPSRVYYGTDTRVQSLLVGALLAMFLARRSDVQRPAARLALQGSAVASAAVLGWWWSTVSDHTTWLYHGGFLAQALLVAVVIAAVTQARSGPLGAVLALRPVRWVGAISYGLYLWHWPVYVALDSARTGLDGTALLLTRLAATFAVATASYYLVERPIRYGALTGWRLRLAVPSAASGVAVALVLVTAGAPQAPVEVAASDLRAPPTSTVARVSAATAVAPATRVLVVGDSVAHSAAPGLERLASADNLVVWNAAIPGCGLAGDTSDMWVGRWHQESSNCVPGWRERWPRHLAEFRPDVVVALLGAHDTFDRRVGGQTVRFDTPEGADLARRDLQEAVGVLTSSGAQLVLLTAPYYTVGWPMEIVVDRSYLNPRWIDRWNDLVREVGAANPGKVQVVDLNRYVDPGGAWTPTVDGVQVRQADKMHFTDGGADLVARWLAPQLRALRPAAEPAGDQPEAALSVAAAAAGG